MPKKRKFLLLLIAFHPLISGKKQLAAYMHQEKEFNDYAKQVLASV